MNLAEVFARALASPAIDPSRFHGEPLAAVGASTFDLIAVGKAAGAMTDGVLAVEGTHLARARVILPNGAPSPRADPRLTVHRAAHPLPDARSVAAGEAALELAREGRGDVLRVLVSGGASSLAFAPAPGVSLDEARGVIRALLSSGADVRATNVVRRHLSRFHGGALVRASSRLVLSCIDSDVIDGALHDVGSGPSVPDPTTIDDARAVLRRYAPAYASLPLVETFKPTDPAATFARPTLTGAPERLAAAMVTELQRDGFTARTLPSSLADVHTLAAELLAHAASLAPRHALVRSAEPALEVTAPHPGHGGRSTHLAALVASGLPPGLVFGAFASDGVDGTSGTAGAVVTSSTFPDPAVVAAALAAFDTGPLHLRAGSAVPESPTGRNLADLHVLVRM